MAAKKIPDSHWEHPEIIMEITAPRGNLRLFEPIATLGSKKKVILDKQVRAIRLFMGQHRCQHRFILGRKKRLSL